MNGKVFTNIDEDEGWCHGQIIQILNDTDPSKKNTVEYFTELEKYLYFQKLGLDDDDLTDDFRRELIIQSFMERNSHGKVAILLFYKDDFGMSDYPAEFNNFINDPSNKEKFKDMIINSKIRGYTERVDTDEKINREYAQK